MARAAAREERRCRECQLGKIEDVPHWLLECDAWSIKRQTLLQCMRQIINDFDSLGDDDKLICILDAWMQGCISIESHYEDVDCSILVANAPFQGPGLTDCR